MNKIPAPWRYIPSNRSYGARYEHPKGLRVCEVTQGRFYVPTYITDQGDTRGCATFDALTHALDYAEEAL